MLGLVLVLFSRRLRQGRDYENPGRELDLSVGPGCINRDTTHEHRSPEVTVAYKPAGICRNPEKVLEFCGRMEWGFEPILFVY